MDGGRVRGREGMSRPSRSCSGSRQRSFAAEAPVRTIPEGLLTKVGEGGIPVRLYSNHFRLKTPSDAIIYDYHISFEPILEDARLRRKLIYQQRELFNSCYIFDGGANVKSQHQILDTLTVKATNYVNESVEITIKPTGRISWGHPEMMRFYNTQMRRNLTLIGMTAIGRNFFDKSGSKAIPEHSVEVWPGMLTAINEHDAGIMLVANSLNKIIRKETAHDMLKRIHANSNRENFVDYARRELAGAIVMTKYNIKTYRVDDVIFDKNPITYTFDRRGTTINLKDYYQEMYQMTVNDERQPLLVVRPSDRQQRGGVTKSIVLIPELCLLTGITDNLKNDIKFRKEVDRHVKLSPEDRMRSLRKFTGKLTSNESVVGEMAQWSLTLNPELVQLNGRVLPSEKILTSDQSNEDGVLYDQRTGSFDQNIRSEKMRLPVNLESWVIVAPKRDISLIQSYQDLLRRVSGPLGVRLAPPRIIWLDDDRTASYLEYCRKIPADIVKMVHVIVPNNNRERYTAIKRFFAVDNPIPSQVLTRRVLDKNQLAIVTKLVIQMSVKMGARAWGIIIPPKNTMIVGYNTYRDTSRRGHSVGAFVSSTNVTATSWFSKVNYHRSSEEMSSNFANDFRDGLKTWYKANRSFPDKIIIYRDGISEGQIAYVFETETKKLTELLATNEALNNTTWCFIIVNKKVNARFFLKTGSPNVVNPIPGTIVDSVVTRKERYDFYLISQSVRAGTVNPTMYNIIYDNTKWKPINHQQLAYKLCHLYYNWAGTISVPAPCHYAYKLAFLVGSFIHQEPSPALSNFLWYL